jgi:glycosyltransferase involved in cell wall biosynthesis
MNILLACPWDLESPGGVSVLVKSLAIQLVRSGHHVVCLIPKHGGRVRREEKNGLTIYHVSMRRAVNPWRGRVAFVLCFLISCWDVLSIIRRERIQIVNAHYLTETWTYFFWIRRFFPIKLVLSVHGSDVLGRGGPKHLSSLRRQNSAGALDRVVFCSKGFRDQVLPKASPLFAKAEVVLNGVDLDSLAPPLPQTGRRNCIVCVAHLRHHKAQDVLLRAFQLLTRSFAGLQLELIGEGPFRGELERLRQELNLTETVTLRGEVPHEQALESIRTAKVFCLPSRREPFGLVLVEAMASETPVVATVTGGIPEVIRDGFDGLLVKPEDPVALAHALGRILNESGLRSSIINNAAPRAREHFNLQRFGEDYARCLSQLSH